MDRLFNSGFVLLLAFALWLRITHLDSRPMHTDEAVHAIKFGALLEKGAYFYDANEYHGPTLNYFTLIPAFLQNAHNISEISETTLRIVPAVFGFLLCAGFWLLRDVMGRIAAFFSALFCSVSPSMVYFSRYYIQEMLLVAFVFAVILSGYYLLKTKKYRWAASAGLALGLMHCTKETWIISVACLVFSLLVVTWIEMRKIDRFDWKFLAKSATIAFAVFLLISVLFFSSFGSNPDGLREAVVTYITYLDRAAGDLKHQHPWYYYGQLLIWHAAADGSIWSEAIILVLATFAVAALIFNRKFPVHNRIFVQLLSIFGILMLVTYSAIPYKTPWNLLGFHHIFILLAGLGVAAGFRILKSRTARWIFAIALIAAATHLTWQAWRGITDYAAHPANPYVYAHTHPDVFKMKNQIEDFASAFPEKAAIYLQIICRDSDYWPLPWYLRKFSNIGWWREVPQDVPVAPLIVFSPDLEGAITRKLYFQAPPGRRFLYVRFFDERLFLRPGVELMAYVRKKEWDIWQRKGD